MSASASDPMPDRLSALLTHFDLRARVFHSGALCGAASFDDADGVGHLHLLRRGSLRVEQGPTVLALDQPSLLYFSGNGSHRLQTEPDAPVDLLCASVQLGVGNPLLASLPPLVVLPLADSPTLATILELLFAEAFSGYCGRQAALDRLAELLVLQLLRHLLASRQIESGSLAGLADPQLARALVAIHEQPARAWSLAELAAGCGMSRARFAARFREVVGATPGDYLAGWRVAMAQRLLRQGRPVKAVAPEVGYANASALARVFSARVGLSPLEWLERS